MTWLHIRDEEMIEWSERKGNHLYKMAEHYEKEAARLQGHFIEPAVPQIRCYSNWRRL